MHAILVAKVESDQNYALRPALNGEIHGLEARIAAGTKRAEAMHKDFVASAVDPHLMHAATSVANVPANAQPGKSSAEPVVRPPIVVAGVENVGPWA